MIDFVDPIMQIVFDGQMLPVGGGEPDDYVYSYPGHVLIYDNENDEPIKIGHFKLTLLDILNAVENGHDAYDVFDASAELSGFCSIYNAGTLELSKAVKEPLYEIHDEIVEHLNVLVIERLQIYANFRGKQLGRLIIKALIKRFRHGVAVVALKPYPLQFEYGIDANELLAFELDKFSKSETTANNKLKKYYQKIGFVPLKKTGIMVLNPNL